VAIDDGEGCKRGAAASLLAIHAVCRPVAVREPIKRNKLTAEKKLIAESLLEEVKTALGWLLDTCRFLISLTLNKYSEWAVAIIFILITKSCSYHDLETLVGWLNHDCFVITAARHVMSRLGWLLHTSRQGQRIRPRPQVLADLRLWLSFLCLAHWGISLNLISFQTPTHVFRFDASEHGIDGFCAISGNAWSLEILTDC
jgi:hypothetical protein